MYVFRLHLAEMNICNWILGRKCSRQYFAVESAIYCFMLNRTGDMCFNNPIFKEQTICAKCI